MAKAEFKVNGLKALRERLAKARDALNMKLEIRLAYLGEQAATHAKEHKGYHDRTANLKNSISYVLYHDGQPIQTGIGHAEQGTDTMTTAQLDSQIRENIESFAQEHVQPKGYTLIVVAGMNYGKHVEDKGYNVLYLTRYFMETELKKLIQEILDDVKNGKI